MSIPQQQSAESAAAASAEPAGAGFPRSARLLTPKQYQTVFAQGRRLNGALYRLHVRPLTADVEDAESDANAAMTSPDFVSGPRPAQGARLGIAVSRRVDPHAVGRNRIKRIARESFRHVRDQLPDGDYVLLAQSAAADADNEQLRQALAALWLRAGAKPPSLKPGAAAVTMHANTEAEPARPEPENQPPSS